jgi:tetrahydromethanopterin S-methyltransferase subunit G
MMSGNNKNMHFADFSLAKAAAFGMIGLFVAGQAVAAKDENPGLPFDQIESKLDALEVKVDTIEGETNQLSDIADVIEDIDAKLDALPDNSSDIAALESKLDVIEMKLDLIEVKLDEQTAVRDSSTIFAARTGFDSGSGVTGADNLCQISATSAGLSGSFVAWLSTDSQDARDRLVIIDKPYVRPDGVVVAANLADLLDGNPLANAIAVDEYGVEFESNNWVYTGTGNDGRADGPNCEDWTIGTTGSGVFATAGAVKNTDIWTKAFGQPTCGWNTLGPTNEALVYCVEQ